MAVAVEKQVAWLDISVQEVRRMHELKRLHQLVYDVFLVNLLQNVGANDGVEVSLCRGRAASGEMRISSERAPTFQQVVVCTVGARKEGT